MLVLASCIRVFYPIISKKDFSVFEILTQAAGVSQPNTGQENKTRLRLTTADGSTARQLISFLQSTGADVTFLSAPTNTFAEA